MNFCVAKKKLYAIERWTKDMAFTIGINAWIDLRTHIYIYPLDKADRLFLPKGYSKK